MTKLSDAIAALETERDSLLVQCEKQEERIAKQAGAIMENRARIGQQDKIIQRQATLIANYQCFFRALGHGSEDLKKQEGNTTELMGSGPEGRARSEGNGKSQPFGTRGTATRTSQEISDAPEHAEPRASKMPSLPNPSLLKRLQQANGSGVH